MKQKRRILKCNYEFDLDSYQIIMHIRVKVFPRKPRPRESVLDITFIQKEQARWCRILNGGIEVSEITYEIVMRRIRGILINDLHLDIDGQYEMIIV